jgi:DNA-binding winged helix-turn-helix (wHTH) protein/Tfp pilus assembly protein PilF
MTFRFGPFEADRKAYRATRNGVALDLTPKLLDLLFHFLDRPGVLVTKEELLDSVWPGANVTENAMAQAVSDLREALGDDAASPTFIKTVSRRGYRFIADVQTAPLAAPGDASAPIIAVMDFVNVTNDADVAWLGAGVAETVTTDLAALDRFTVVDRWRVLDAVRHAGGSLTAAGAALGATQLVTGSFQRSGANVRITARLMNLQDGSAAADVKVDGRLEDIFSLQDGIVRAFTRDLRLPAQTTHRRAGGRETADLDAYRAYIEGWLKIESLDLDSIPAAIADFERAIAIDPRFASAYTGLSTAEWIAYEMSRATRAPNFRALRSGIEHARLAIQIDSELADAHAALSFVLSSALQFEEARRAAAQAVTLEPDNWRHHFRLGHAHWGQARLTALAHALELYPHFAYTRLDTAMVLIARGQDARAMDVVRQGVAEQDRQSLTADRYPAIGFHFLTGALHAARGAFLPALEEFDREVEQAGQRGLYREEYAAASLVWRGYAALQLDRVDDAADAFTSAEAYLDDYPRALLGQATVAIRRGDRARADALQRQAQAVVAGMRQPDRPTEWLYGRACIAASVGDASTAAALLNQLLDGVPASFVGWQLPIDPAFMAIRHDAGFTGVLARLADRAK